MLGIDEVGAQLGTFETVLLLGVNFGVAVGAAVLATLHIIGGRLRFLSYVPRSGWLSFAGGISVAYVFVHLLPELAAGARVVEQELGDPIASQHVVWLIALTGMVAFYGLEVASRDSPGKEGGGTATGVAVYRLSMIVYGVYNAVIAYQLHERADEGGVSLTLFVSAMALHFLVNDFSLREHHKQRYETEGRWVLVGFVAAGALVGAVTDVLVVSIELTTALIAGGVVLNVMKEELPAQAESRFSAFLAGVVSYALLLLAL